MSLPTRTNGKPCTTSSLDACGCAWLITNCTWLSSSMASQRASTSETKVMRADRGSRLEPMQPTRQKGERQGVRCSESQRRRVSLRHRPRLAGNARHASHQIVGRVPEPLPGCGQLGRLAAAVEQLRAQPLFQRTNASAEGRLGHVPLLGCTREVSAGHEGEEVIQPRQVHGHDGAVLSGHQRRKKQHWRCERLPTIIRSVIHTTARDKPP